MANNPLKVLSDLSVREQSVMNKGLVVSGSVSGSTGVYVKKDVVVGGDLIVSGTVENSGYAQAGALQVDGILDVAGNAYISGAAEIEGNLTVDGQFYAVTQSADNLYVGKNASFGQQRLLEVHQQGQNGSGNPSLSYVYAGQKLLIKPDTGFVSGSVYSQQALIDLGDIDSTVPPGTNAVDIAKSLKNLDDFLFRLNQIIEF